MKRPRPFTADERQHTTATLTGLVAELERADAGRIQQLIGVLMDSGYSATASGAAATGGGGGGDTVLTVVESKASRPDPVALEARILALRLHRLRHDADEILRALRSLRSDRDTGLCSEGHPMKAGAKVCLWKDPVTGDRCSTVQDVVRVCGNPQCVNDEGTGPRTIPKGSPRRRAKALDLGGIEVWECPRCAKYRERNKRSWGDATRLSPGAMGAYSSDDPWPETG